MEETGGEGTQLAVVFNLRIKLDVAWLSGLVGKVDRDALIVRGSGQLNAALSSRMGEAAAAVPVARGRDSGLARCSRMRWWLSLSVRLKPKTGEDGTA